MNAVLALVRKDLLVTVRAPLFAVISVLVPVAFTMLYAIVIHVSTTSSVVVAQDDRSQEAEAFLQVMRQMHNDDGLYYEIRTTDSQMARRMYRSGQSGALITIPPGFGAAVRAGERAQVSLQLVNINADGTKNQHLRLENAVREFENRLPQRAVGKLQIKERTALQRDVPISIYLGSALMVFAALYAGMVNSGTLLAREWEERTAKELVMSPMGTISLIAGKWLSGAALSLITVTCGVLGVAWVLGYPLTRLGWSSVAVLSLIWMYGAGLGSLLGVTFRRSLPLIPVAVVLTVFHFLVSGYESYIRGFAHGGLVEPLWRYTHGIPLSTLTDAIRFNVTGLGFPLGLLSAALWSTAIALLVSVFAMWQISRQIRFTQGQ